ncbi:MAG: hypothetical protein WC196_02940 [Bacilli bacterium]
MDTGDVIQCSGKGLASGLIKWRTGCDMSHTGTLVIMDRTVFLWHITSLGKGKSSPQLIEFRQWLQQYKGKVYWRRLCFDRTLEFRYQYLKTIDEFKDKVYERDLIELLGAASALIKNKKDLTDLFCSELKAEVDQRTFVIDDKLPSNEYSPKDYMPLEKIEKHLINGARYEKLVRLK